MGVEIVRRKRSAWDDRSISIIITAHNEGTLIAKTVESCRRALKHAEGYHSASEIVLVCDRPTQKTAELAELLVERGLVSSMHVTDFGDPGLARNAGVSLARGHFVSFVDGDDLINHTYLKAFLLKGEKISGKFLRPQMVITFGDEKAFLLQFDSQKIKNNEVMIYSNPWAMPVFGRRADFLTMPFEGDDKENGFSHEDWEWNLKVLNSGFRFEAVDDAIYFARRRRGSRTSEARAFQYVIRPMDFYRNKDNFPAVADARLDLNERFKDEMIGKIDAEAYFFADPFYMRDFREKKAHSALDHFMRIGKRQDSVARKLEAGDHIGKFAANASIESMIVLSDLEGRLDPANYWAGDVPHYDVLIEDRDTTVWREILNTGIFDRNWDVVFVLPWVRRGGADLVALKHVRACTELGLNVCIITTLDHENEWPERMPEGASVLPFGSIAKDVSHIIQLEVFHRLLVELQPSVIHNINSELMWKVLERNGLSIRSNTKVVASLYCQDYNFAGSSVGYDRYVDVCDNYVDQYVTDNSVFADYLSERLGVAPRKVVTARYPVEIGRVNTNKTMFRKRGKVLWASRLDYQKGADLLKDVANAMPRLEFHFYGEVMLDAFELGDVMLPPNQVYRGKFSHIEEINPDEFDCFLYTARWDGLPNIVLEMGMKRLPIISFVTGGLSDVIADETAWPVEEVNPSAVIRALTAFYKSEDHGYERASAMRELLSREHSEDAFARQCDEIYRANNKERLTSHREKHSSAAAT